VTGELKTTIKNNSKITNQTTTTSTTTTTKQKLHSNQCCNF
jgi:hypothetical protein